MTRFLRRQLIYICKKLLVIWYFHRLNCVSACLVWGRSRIRSSIESSKKYEKEQQLDGSESR